MRVLYPPAPPQHTRREGMRMNTWLSEKRRSFMLQIRITTFNRIDQLPLIFGVQLTYSGIYFSLAPLAIASIFCFPSHFRICFLWCEVKNDTCASGAKLRFVRPISSCMERASGKETQLEFTQLKLWEGPRFWNASDPCSSLSLPNAFEVVDGPVERAEVLTCPLLDLFHFKLCLQQAYYSLDKMRLAFYAVRLTSPNANVSFHTL